MNVLEILQLTDGLVLTSTPASFESSPADAQQAEFAVEVLSGPMVASEAL